MLGAFGSVVNGASFPSVSSRFLNALTVCLWGPKPNSQEERSTNSQLAV